MRAYNKITRSLQRTADQLRSLREKNSRKAQSHRYHVDFLNRVHAKVTDIKSNLVVKRYNSIVKLDAESDRAEKTAAKIEGLLS
jgi:hypothetical protein